MATNFIQDGRLITLLESAITHPSHTDGFVNSGDAVVIGKIVGVAMEDGTAATDLIAIDTQGVYLLSVSGTTNSGASSAVAVGDTLYIDGSTALLTKDTTKTVFGKALGTVTAAATSSINVMITN